MADAPDRSATGLDSDPNLPPGVEAAEPYRSVSLPAVAALCLAVLYALLVPLGGVAAFSARYPLAFKVLAVLVPVGAVLAGVLARVREPGRLAALAGLALAGLYAVLGLGGLLAFSGSSPWLLPDWTLVLPVAAAFLAWFARVRIRSSEGTQSGLPLTNWALGLSLFFGLNYAAYLASNRLAVRAQANNFAGEWLRKIQDNQLESAFLFTIPASSRPSENVRTAIESAHNTPSSPSQPGAFSSFLKADYVQLLRHAGEDAKIESLGAKVEPSEGGYKVEQVYRIRTDLAEFDLQVTLISAEPTTQRGPGRQWSIQIYQSGIRGQLDRTDKGKEVERVAGGANRFAQDWVNRLRAGDFEAVYLDTLPAGERERELAFAAKYGPPLQAGAGAVGLVGLFVEDPAYRALQDRVRKFQEKAPVVRAESGTFWAINQRVRKEVVDQVKGVFDPPAFGFHPEVIDQLPRLALLEREEGRVRLSHPVRINLPDLGRGGLEYVAEADVVVVSDVPAERLTPAGPWRVLYLELNRALSAPERPDPRKPMPPRPQG